ncbi:DEAD/DEAH box helicase [Devosia pacifica]|uniref:DEAD/DEAH box helicase n=1 Tax=Devosia pacifica TaxID=1335967 RepID=UPI001FCE60CC|nr:DEAD/DEAH box helicase [Devosia pacifica]
MTNFSSLGLPAALSDSLAAAGFIEPTLIQREAIPALVEGRDMLGIAQTGSGKTAAFALPILAAIMALPGRPRPMSARALILAPTRELAVQIEKAVRSFASGNKRITTALVLGGVSRQQQVLKLAKGVDVLVATPGRLNDLLDDGKVWLSETRFLVLDEADRMLDMGFIAPVKKIAKAVGHKRQTMLFSATMASNVAELAKGLLNDPVRVEATPQGSTVETIEQRVVMADSKAKRDALNKLLADPALSRVIVFARTKHRADKVTKQLEIDGFKAAAIHGNKSQNARQGALSRFSSGQIRLLVATDIAARGIDISGITHVINYDLPDDSENYVHRIGRTGRNGASGIAITLCDGTEVPKLREVEKLTRQRFEVSGDTQLLQKGAAAAPAKPQRSRKPSNGARPERSEKPQRDARPSRPHGDKPAAQKPSGNKQRWDRNKKIAGKARREDSVRRERVA